MLLAILQNGIGKTSHYMSTCNEAKFKL